MGGYKLVINDVQEGQQKALSQVNIGAGWQHSRVHFMRNLLAKILLSWVFFISVAIFQRNYLWWLLFPSVPIFPRVKQHR